MTLPKKRITLDQAIIKIRTFCNYRDRCHKEVRDKLYALGLWKQEVDQVLMQMIDENLLNEERYAHSFARGYFKNKGWGKYKIKVELRKRFIHEKLIDQALTEIDDDDYQATIIHLIEKKLNSLDTSKQIELKSKVSNYLLQKGYRFQDFAVLMNEQIEREKKTKR